VVIVSKLLGIFSKIVVFDKVLVIVKDAVNAVLSDGYSTVGFTTTAIFVFAVATAILGLLDGPKAVVSVIIGIWHPPETMKWRRTLTQTALGIALSMIGN